MDGYLIVKESLEPEKDFLRESLTQPGLFMDTFKPFAQSSLRGSVLTLCSSTLGPGFLTLPFAFKLAGLLPGLFVLVLVGLIYAMHYRVLVMAHEVTRVYSFTGVVQLLLGVNWRKTVEVFLLLLRFGMICVTQMVLINCIMGILEQLLGLHGIKVPLLIASNILVVFPMVLFMQVGVLKYLCSVFNFFVGLLALILVVQLPSYSAYNLVEPSLLGPSPLLGFTLVVYAFDSGTAFPIIYSELQKRSTKRIKKVVTYSTSINLTLYIVVSVAGYFALGSQTPQVITNRPYYWGTDWCMMVANSMLLLSLLGTLPLRILNMLEAAQFAFESLERFYCPMVTLTIAISTIISVFSEDITKCISILVGTLVLFLVTVVPWLLLCKIETKPWKILLTGVLCLGLQILGVYSSFEAVMN